MVDEMLKNRLNAVLVGLSANILLLIGLGYKFAPDNTGAAIFAALVVALVVVIRG